MGRHRCPHCGGIIVIVKEEVDEEDELEEDDELVCDIGDEEL